MKKSLLFALALLLTGAAFAQSNGLFSNWKLKRAGVFIGQDQDMLSAMDYQYFLESTRTPTQFNFADINATEEHVYSMLCENPHFRFNTSFQNQKISNLEMGLSLLAIFNRIDEVQYVTPGTDWWSDDYQSLTFTQFGSELAIEPTISWRQQRGAWALTGTLGANAGYTFGNDLSIYGRNVTICNDAITFREDGMDMDDCEILPFLYEYARQNNGASVRAFAEVNGSFTILQRLEMGMQLRRGIGMRYTNNASSVSTRLHSAGVYMRWVLR